MTVVEFIRRKNELIFKHNGLVLVPEDQIQEVEAKPLDISYDGEACPYCQIYNEETYCDGCPMDRAGNNCMDYGSTYRSILSEVDFQIVQKSTPWYNELVDLVRQYNKELKKD